MWTVSMKHQFGIFLLLCGGYVMADKLIWVHGHRGSRGTHPENTIPAFAEAVMAGAQVLEMDLQLSKDQIPVVSHEPMITGQLCRDSTGKPVREPIAIRVLTLSEIKQFDCGSVKQEKFPEQKLIPNTPIPTLDEVLLWTEKMAPNVLFNIETKMSAPKAEWVADPQLFAETVVSVLRKFRVVERTLLQSFDFRTLGWARKLEPKIRLSCLFENQSDFCDLTVKFGGDIASPHFRLVTPERVKVCHEKKVQVVPWTVNDERGWQKMTDAGVDGIITDYPRKLVNYLSGGG